MVGDALSLWHSRYYKVSRISKMVLSMINSGPLFAALLDDRPYQFAGLRYQYPIDLTRNRLNRK